MDTRTPMEDISIKPWTKKCRRFDPFETEIFLCHGVKTKPRHVWLPLPVFFLAYCAWSLVSSRILAAHVLKSLVTRKLILPSRIEQRTTSKQCRFQKLRAINDICRTRSIQFPLLSALLVRCPELNCVQKIRIAYSECM